MSTRVLKLAIIGDVSSLERGLRKARVATTAFERTMKTAKIAAAAAGVAVGVGLVASAVRGAQSLMRLERISAQTNAVIRSTGGIAGVTAAQVARLADSIEKKTGVDEEAIRQGQSLLLTFTKIRDAAGQGNDIFTQTTRMMVDMSTAMGTDMRGAAIQLGKALQDPIRGTAALRRVGVSFTEAQEAQIRTLVEAGRHLEAQQLILQELRVQFGGVAEAVGKTLPGQIAILGHMWGDLQEQLAAKVMPTLTRAVSALLDAWPRIEAAVDRGTRLIGAALANATALTVALGSAMVLLRWKSIVEFVVGMKKATAALWAKVAAAKAAKVGLITLLGLTGPKGWVALAGGIAAASAALGITNRMTAAATGQQAELTGAAAGAAAGQRQLADALTDAGEAAGRNLLSFDQVHQLQEEMAQAPGAVLPGLVLPELPKLEVPDTPGMGEAWADMAKGLDTLVDSANKAAKGADKLTAAARTATDGLDIFGGGAHEAGEQLEVLRAASGDAWPVIGEAATRASGTVVGAWERARDRLSEIWATLRTWASERWSLMATTIKEQTGATTEGILGTWAHARDRLGQVWSTLGAWASERWSAIGTTIGGKVSTVTEGILGPWGRARDRLSEIWDSIRSRAGERWDAISAAIGGRVSAMADGALGPWGRARDRLGEIWDSIRSQASERWGAIRDAVVDRVNAIIATVNRLIDAFNRIPLLPDLPKLPTIAAPAIAPPIIAPPVAARGQTAVAPVAAPVQAAVAPVVARVEAAVARVAAPVQAAVAPVVARVEAAVARVAAPVQAAVAPVVAAIARVIAPAVAPRLPAVRGAAWPQYEEMAAGGIVRRPTFAMLGEAGPEAVLPLRAGTPGVDAIADAVGNAVLTAMRAVLAERGGGDAPRELVLEIDGTRLGRLLLPTLQQENIRLGLRTVVV